MEEAKRARMEVDLERNFMLMESIAFELWWLFGLIAF